LNLGIVLLEMLFLLIQLAPYSSLGAAIRCSAMAGPSIVTFTAALTFFDGRVSAGGQDGLPVREA
jgi:hypothetical protein